MKMNFKFLKTRFLRLLYEKYRIKIIKDKRKEDEILFEIPVYKQEILISDILSVFNILLTNQNCIFFSQYYLLSSK